MSPGGPLFSKMNFVRRWLTKEGGSVIKNLPDKQETQGRSPGGSSWRRVGKIPWRRKWQCTSVFLPGKYYGQRSLAGYIVHGVTKSQTWLRNFINTIKVRRYHILNWSRRLMLQLQTIALTGISNMGLCVGSKPHWRGQAVVTREEGWTEPQVEAKAGSGGQRHIKVFSQGIPNTVWPSSKWGARKFPYLFHSQEQLIKVITIIATATWSTKWQALCFMCFFLLKTCDPVRLMRPFYKWDIQA